MKDVWRREEFLFAKYILLDLTSFVGISLYKKK